MMYWIGFFIVAFVVMSSIIAFDLNFGKIGTFFITILVEVLYSAAFIIYYTNFDDGYLQKQKLEAAKEAENLRRAQIPHVIREADGCKVYEFWASGRYQFFTRCKETVTTTNNYEVCKNVQQGKTTRKECHIEQNDIQTVK